MAWRSSSSPPPTCWPRSAPSGARARRSWASPPSTGRRRRRAREKLARKGLDLLVVNDISRSDIGFDADHNEVALVTAAAERRIERAPKAAVAAAILDAVQRLRTALEAPSTFEERS